MTVFDVVRIEHPETRALVDAVVMEWLEETTLTARLKSRERLTFEEVTSTSLAILEGVRVIHEAGTTHGDLHSDNVILTDDGPKIIDLSYFDSLSRARLTINSRESLIRGDVESASFLVQRMLHHSTVEIARFPEALEAIRKAETLESIEEVLGTLSPRPEGVHCVTYTVELPTAAIVCTEIETKSFEKTFMPEEVELLLVAGSEDVGSVSLYDDTSHFILSIGGFSLRSTTSARQRARWNEAIARLTAKGCLTKNPSSTFTDFYEVTVLGYDVADALAAKLSRER